MGIVPWDDVDAKPLEDIREYTNAELLSGGNPPARARMLVTQKLIDNFGMETVQTEGDKVARAWGFPDGAKIEIYESEGEWNAADRIE